MKKNKKDFNRDTKKKHRINERIRIRQLRVISPEGEQLGIIDREEALRIAKNHGLDLVEVAPLARPPVCKILDYGKMQYEQSKRLKQQRKSQQQTTKTVQFRPNIGESDLLRKISNIQTFLDKGYRVVVLVTMKGRQRRHVRLAEDQTINRVRDELVDATMEGSQHQGGRITASFVKNDLTKDE